MKHFLTIFILLTSALAIQAQTTYQLDSTILTAREIKGGLDIPWEITWGPDDHIWCTERYGRVSRINPATGQQDILLDLSSEVYEQAEAGMLGMVLHPDFASIPDLFIAYTYLENRNIRERLVRYRYTGITLEPVDTLIEGITGNTTHIGCRLIILPDNTLLMTTGDAQNLSLPQDTNSVVGKILRMNLDGSVPADNPNPTSLVWSHGHRNAQGLWLAPNGHVYSSEHGPTTDDELNIIKANTNYGWPDVRGFCDSPPEMTFCSNHNIEEPLAAWTPTIAPSDIIWYDHPAIPEWNGTLLMTVLKDKTLKVFDFNAAGDSVTRERTFFRNAFGRLRDVCVSPSGKVYLATNGSSWSNTSPFTHSIMELSNDAYSPPTAIDDVVDRAPMVSLSPNPLASGQTLTVSLARSQTGRFELYDLSGRLMLKRQIRDSERLTLHTKAGIYFYRFVDGQGLHTSGKLIVK